jgi:hypothetical protein
MLSQKRKGIGEIRVSDRHQRSHMKDQEAEIIKCAEEEDIELIRIFKTIAPVWSSKWKRLRLQHAQFARDNDCTVVIAETSLRLQKSKDWSTKNPYPRLSKDEIKELQNAYNGLDIMFIADDDYTSEHSLQTKRGERKKRGSYEKKSKLKEMVFELAKEGRTTRKISEIVSTEKVQISAMTVSRWLRSPGICYKGLAS